MCCNRKIINFRVIFTSPFFPKCNVQAIQDPGSLWPEWSKRKKCLRLQQVNESFLSLSLQEVQVAPQILGLLWVLVFLPLPADPSLPELQVAPVTYSKQALSKTAAIPVVMILISSFK